MGHATLSGNDDNILIGNMLGDFIKGNKYLNYPLSIQKGMRYHRLLDEYTDQHPSVRDATKLLRAEGIRYAGVFIDILFDYFIANDSTFFKNDKELEEFTLSTLGKLESAYEIMSEDMKTYFGYMIRYNWLYHYRSRSGIEKAIIGLIKRHPRLGNADEILFALFNNEEALRPMYQNFIKEAVVWSESTLRKY
mgnify:CR=1 FL=1